MAKVIIVNEDNQQIGLKERESIKQEDIYRVSALWITNSKEEILLAQRAFSKNNDPGLWGPAVAGTNEEGETYESNIIKETEEEIGIKNITFTKVDLKRVKGKHNFFGQLFKTTIDKKIEEFKIQEEEVEKIKWFTREELKQDLIQNPEKFLKSVKECFERIK